MEKHRNDSLVSTRTSKYRVYDYEECQPARKGTIPMTFCKHDRVAYVDKQFNRNCPMANLLA